MKEQDIVEALTESWLAGSSWDWETNVKVKK